ncbi:hypothetical protein SAMN04487980_10721 [Streptomyces sp. cf124]|uniref:hypothetical protein n=1 Tax=Streptomyces sp. cf124 TaxID=1761903 RepID=UPI0008E1592E|nr:hypothetical protein [Streptomyces sp. cf124]SFO13201.1 hypothetical protein SAMN04487980_10721 [Streptomyces sp. cf124]
MLTAELPVEAGGHPVTFWGEIPAHEVGSAMDVVTLLKQLHRLPVPDLPRDRLDPFVRVAERIEAATSLSEDDRAWLRDRHAGLREQWEQRPQGLPECVEHGDEWVGNVARTTVGPVPVLVSMLREHIQCFGVAADGRVFQNAAGNYVDFAAYGITWRRAREAPLTLEEHALELVKRPYDLRHAGISFWLASGVDPAECARRAGQSIQVLFRYYAKFLAEARDHANRLIEESMKQWEAPDSGREGV